MTVRPLTDTQLHTLRELRAACFDSRLAERPGWIRTRHLATAGRAPVLRKLEEFGYAERRLAADLFPGQPVTPTEHFWRITPAGVDRLRRLSAPSERLAS